MPTVPYSGAPTVSPQENPTPRYTADINPATFGVNVAQAVEGLGKTVSGAGDELWTRAVAMQDLYNHSAAQEGAAQFQHEAGVIHAKVESLQGKDRVDYYTNQFNPDMTDARKRIRDGLPNDMARKLYDSESLSTMGRTDFNAAGLSGRANREYAVGASKARTAASEDAALSMPNDDAGFKREVANVEANTRFENAGQSPEFQDQAVADAVSRLWSKRIEGVMQTQPQAAKAMFDEAVKNGDLRGVDVINMGNKITSVNRNVGARMTSLSIRNGSNLSWGAGKIDIKDAGRAIAEIESGGDYNQRTNTGSRHGIALGKYQFMSGFLQGFLKEAGMAPMTPDEFIANHAAQEQLFASRFQMLMDETGSANGAAARWIGLSGKDAFGTDAPKYVRMFNGQLAKNATLRQKIDQGNQIAVDQFPNDPLMPQYIENQLITDTTREKAIDREDAQNRSNVLSDALQGNLTDGQIPKNVDELKAASPEASAAYEAMSPPNQLKWQKNIISYNNAINKQTEAATRQYLLGLATSDDPDDVEKFINTNIYQQSLSPGDMNGFSKRQRDLQKERGLSVETQQAIQAIKPIIDAAGVDLKDKVLTTKLRGAMVEAVQDWHLRNPGKPLSAADAKQMGIDLTQQMTSENFWYGKDYMFNLPLPTSLKKQFETQVGHELTDTETEQYREEYVRQMFNSVQKSRAKTTPAAQPTQSQASK